MMWIAIEKGDLMKFPHIIGRREMIRAALLGSMTGFVGVLVFILMLNAMSPTYKEEAQSEKVIPVSSEVKEEKKENDSEQFYANQYGVFSTFEKATEFVYGNSRLNTSAVIEIDGSYYVWSNVATTKEGIVPSEDPPSFVKPFKLIAAGCSEPALKSIPSLLKSEDPSNFHFEKGEKKENLPPDWETINIALSSISSDLSVIRMHLLAHYFTENECLKIEF